MEPLKTYATEEYLETDQTDVNTVLSRPPGAVDVNTVAVGPVEVLPSKPVEVPSKDKVNNIQQKEKAIHAVGLTRYKYISKIVEALDAVKTEEYRDSQGNVKYRYEPDFEKNKWGVEQAAKLFGDYIIQVDANVRVTHSVEELLAVFDKAQAKRLEAK